MKAKKVAMLFFIINALSQAAITSGVVDYQLYKDFAMNRGKFKVGAENVVITRKDGTTRTLNFKIPDFSSTDSNAVGTLIDPGYVAGVAHNGGYKSVKYGYHAGHTYKLVDRNDHPDKRDLHVPRLNKLVTDVAPSAVKDEESNPSDYEVFVRVGSGTQYIKEPGKGPQHVAGAYNHLTGGVVLGHNLSNRWTVQDQGHHLDDLIKTQLATNLQPGDSGSPLWGFNKKKQKWELIAFGRAISKTHSFYIPFSKDFMDNEIKKDTLEEFIAKKDGEEITWGATENYNINSNKGTGTISQGDKTLTYNGIKSDIDLNKASNDELNHGKHIIFGGEGGTIKLQDNINQGAGKIHFKNNFTVTGKDETTSWVGAGLQIDKDKTVNWELKGVKGDNLHKIGEGTLHVKGTGVNEGGLNVGDGLVILEQKADKDGKTQVFNNIDIVSGRATVRLTDDKQVDTSKIKFGFRGGRLDIYGNKITFGEINATDAGAQIVNQNQDKKASLVIDTDKFNEKNTSIFHGTFGETNKDKFNGELDVNIGGTGTVDKTLAVTGGSNLNGDINITSGNTTLILAGDRELHAQENMKVTMLKGDYKFSEFNFKNLNMAKDSDFFGGVYSAINGDVNTEGKNNVTLGYISGESKYVYDESQNTWTQTAVGITMNDENTDGKMKEITTYFKGNLNIDKESSLKAGYTDIQGTINLKNSSLAALNNSVVKGSIFSDKTSKVDLNNSTWFAKNGSNVSDLILNEGTVVFGEKFLGEADKPETLNIAEDVYSKVHVDKLQGKGSLMFNVNSDSGEGGKLNVGNIGDKGVDLDLQVKNTSSIGYGKEIDLVTVENLKEGDVDKIKLSSDGKDQIDIGAVRGDLQLNVGLDGKGQIGIITKNYLNKMTASDMSNAGLSNFAAKTSVIKSQKNLLEDSLDNMNSNDFIPGASYKGNYSEAKYESDKFREFSQSTINHGMAYETVAAVDNKWDLYKGMAFLYGRSNVDYEGDYSGEIKTYSANIYGKLMKNNGFFVKGVLGANYTETSLNDEKEKGYSLTVGTGAGVEKNYGSFKVAAGTNLNLFYFPQESYKLADKHGVSYDVINKQATVVELNPEVKVSKAFALGKNSKLSLYAGAGYEYNFYLNNDGAEVKVDGLNGRTGVIENGATFKLGTDLQIKNATIGAEAKYLTGNDNVEKLTGTLKFEYKF